MENLTEFQIFLLAKQSAMTDMVAEGINVIQESQLVEAINMML